MARSVNKVILVGHVGKAPELKNTTGGTTVANFSLATSERYRDRNNVVVDNTEWHNIVAFDRQAEIVRDYVQKGALLYIEGRMKTRSWEDKDSGKKMYRTEIIVDRLTMLDSKQTSEARNTGAGQQPGADAGGPGAGDNSRGDAYEEMADSIPF